MIAVVALRYRLWYHEERKEGARVRTSEVRSRCLGVASSLRLCEIASMSTAELPFERKGRQQHSMF